MNKILIIGLTFTLFSLSCTHEKETRNAVVSHNNQYWDIHYLPETVELSPEKFTNYYWFEAGNIHINQGGYSNYLLVGECKIYSENNKMLKKGNFNNGLKNGLWKTWDENGILTESIEYKNGLKHGENTTFYKNGSLKLILCYKNGLLNGETTEYYPNHRVKETRNYKNDVLYGKRSYYNEEQILTKTEEYKDGKLHGKQIIYKNDTVIENSYNNGVLIIPEKPEKTPRVTEQPDSTKNRGFFERIFTKKADE